jgi:hypothetical protein
MRLEEVYYGGDQTSIGQRPWFLLIFRWNTEEDVMKNLEELVGQDLAGFTIVKMTEVYSVDDDGRRRGSIGFFRDPKIAKAFLGEEVERPWKRLASALVLTNGQVGFRVDNPEPVKLFDDEQEANRLRELALSHLTTEQRALLGFPEKS